MPPRIRLYVAVSLDGRIADADGGVDWLSPYDSPDFGFEAFLAGIAVVVMGRTTYEKSLSFDGWPYRGKRAVVLTGRPLGDAPPEGVTAWSGDVGPLAAELRATAGGDIWHVGGGIAARPFLEGGHIDRLELWQIPVVLGGGIPLFAAPLPPARFRLDEWTAYPNGVVNLSYARAV